MSQKVYDVITAKIIESLESGDVPWRRPWNTQKFQLGEARNLISQKPYRGINSLMTYLIPWESPYFLTFKQAQSIGANVKRGERGTPIVFWSFSEKEVKNKSGENEKRKLAFCRYYTAFNVTQIENIPANLQKIINLERPEKKKMLTQAQRIDVCEAIYKSMQNRPQLKSGGQTAYYRPSEDFVMMPDFEFFHSPEEYYSTLFHELGHSTGHETRLNRKTLKEISGFGDHSYSQEELTAEFTAAFLCGSVGISQKVIENQEAYIKSWLKKLRSDSKFVIEAAQRAQKASDYILNIKAKEEENAA